MEVFRFAGRVILELRELTLLRGVGVRGTRNFRRKLYFNPGLPALITEFTNLEQLLPWIKKGP